MRYVLTLSGDLNNSSESHVQFKTENGKEWRWIKMGFLPKIKDGDVLYLNTHGLYQRKAHGDGWVAVSQKKVAFRGRNITAQGLYEKIGSKLPNLNFKLKIFACYSGGSAWEKENDPKYRDDKTFAGKFASILHKTHPRIWVYGYRDEVKMGANLDFPHQEAGRVLDLDAAGKPINAKPKDLTDDDRASNHRLEFLPAHISEEDFDRWQ